MLWGSFIAAVNVSSLSRRADGRKLQAGNNERRVHSLTPWSCANNRNATIVAHPRLFSREEASDARERAYQRLNKRDIFSGASIICANGTDTASKRGNNSSFGHSQSYRPRGKKEKKERENEKPRSACLAGGALLKGTISLDAPLSSPRDLTLAMFVRSFVRPVCTRKMLLATKHMYLCY